MDIHLPRKRMLSDCHTDNVQVDKQLFNKTFSNFESKKYDSGVESLYASVPQYQTQESSFSNETLGSTKYSSDCNQPNQYEELNNDIWNDIFPVCKQSPITELLSNNDTSHQQVTTLTGDLIHFEACIRTNNQVSLSSDDNQTLNKLKSIPRPSLTVIKNIPELVTDSPFISVEPDRVKEALSTFQHSRNFYSGETCAGDCDNVDLIPTMLIAAQDSSSMAEYRADYREDLYDCVDDGSNFPDDDELLIPEGEQGNARPLPGIPLATGLNGYQNASTHKSILKKKVSCQIRNIIAVLFLALATFVVVVFLAVYITKIVLTKEKNETIDAVKSDERKYELNAQSFLDNSTLISDISGSGAITGVTVLGSELFVVRGRSSQVYVYNTNSFTLTRNISITGSNYLIAIVASPRYNCIYLSDFQFKVVYRYNLSSNVITKWSVDGDCYGLSVTGTGNLLVTVWTSSQVKEYSHDGVLIRVISLDSSIENPYHSVQLPNNRFIVSHGLNGILQRVCIVDTGGHVINCYGGSRGAGVDELYSPRNLAVDIHGNVVVADRFNNRVVLLSPSLTHLGYVNIPGHKMQSPHALHLDELNRFLYIGEDCGDGYVFVLTVNSTLIQ